MTVAGNLVSLEYFWNSDPGFGNASQQIFTTTDETLNTSFVANVPASLPLGNNYLFCRTRDEYGRYSHTNVSGILLSTNEFKVSGIKIYPNPIVNELNIDIADSGKSRLTIYDISGKQILDTIVEGYAKIDMSQLSAGIFTAYFWKETNKIYVVKLIKK